MDGEILRVLNEMRAEQRIMHQRVHEIYMKLGMLQNQVESFVQGSKNKYQSSNSDVCHQEMNPFIQNQILNHSLSTSVLFRGSSTKPSEVTDSRFNTPTKRKLSPRKRRTSESENDMLDILLGSRVFHEKLAKAINDHVGLQESNSQASAAEELQARNVVDTVAATIVSTSNEPAANANTSTNSSHADHLDERTLAEIFEQLQRDVPEFDALFTGEVSSANNAANADSPSKLVEAPEASGNWSSVATTYLSSSSTTTATSTSTTVACQPIWVVPVPIAFPQQIITHDAAEKKTVPRKLLPKGDRADISVRKSNVKPADLDQNQGYVGFSNKNDSDVAGFGLDDQRSDARSHPQNFHTSRSCFATPKQNLSGTQPMWNTIGKTPFTMSPSKISRLLDQLHPPSSN